MYRKTFRFSTAKKTNYQGKQYDSKFEASYAFVLDQRMAAGEIESWEPQKTLDLVVNGYLVAQYRIDFVAHRTDGVTEYIEAKGGAGDSPLWRLKWKLFEALYSEKPDVELHIVWQQAPRNSLRRIKKRIK